MMTRDVMVRLVCETYEVADKISKAERAPDDYENGEFVHVRPSCGATERTSCCNESIS